MTDKKRKSAQRKSQLLRDCVEGWGHSQRLQGDAHLVLRIEHHSLLVQVGLQFRHSACEAVVLCCGGGGVVPLCGGGGEQRHALRLRLRQLRLRLSTRGRLRLLRRVGVREQLVQTTDLALFGLLQLRARRERRDEVRRALASRSV
eukprot:5365214-Pleurochrysis_carterae.AAC.1